jgi:hypothetical protein
MTEQQMADAGYQQDSSGNYVGIGGLAYGQAGGSSSSAPTPPTGSYIINPGSVWQSYNPNTGQTTYGNAPSGFAGGVAQGINAPSVATPAGIPTSGMVYQGNNLGYAPYSPTTAFTPQPDGSFASLYSLNPEKYDLSKPLDAGLTSEKTSDTGFTNEVLKGIQEKNIAEQGKLYDAFNRQYAQGVPGGGAKIVQPFDKTEGYYGQRNIAAEKDAAGRFKNTYGRDPSTPDDWKLIHNALYGGQQFNGPTVPAGALPGANTSNPDSLNAPDPSITDPNTGMIDYNAFRLQYLNDWQKAVNDINKAKTDLANYKAQAGQSMIDIGAQLGVEMPLIYGEEAEFQKRAEVNMQRLTDLIGIAQDEKQYLLEKGDFEMKIFDRIEQQKETLYQHARDLRSDQKEALATVLDLASQAGISTKDMSADSLAWLNSMGKAIGVDSGFILKSLDTLAADKIAKDLQENMLSVDEARALGVPFGTTRQAAAAMGKTPTYKSSGGSGGGGGTITSTTTNSGNQYLDMYNNDPAIKGYVDLLIADSNKLYTVPSKLRDTVFKVKDAVVTEQQRKAIQEARPKTAEAAQSMIQGLIDEGISEQEIVNGLIEDFGFNPASAQRLYNIVSGTGGWSSKK